MTHSSSSPIASWRRHAGVIFDLAALFLCYGIARVWFHPATLMQLAPAFGAILIWNGAVRATPGQASLGEILRPIAIAGLGIGAAFFYAASVRGVAEALGMWCLLVLARPVAVALRGMRSVQWRRPSFVGKTWQKCRMPVLNFLLPVLLAWVCMGILHRQVYGSALKEPERNAYGPVKLRIKLPGMSAGIPEPLVVCGRTGNASMVYIRLLGGNRARVGVEFWGLELSQGEEFSVASADAELELVCEVPAFFPEEGSAAWRNVPPDLRQRRLGGYRVTVDGVVRLEGSTHYRQPPRSGLYFGENPLGGSFISAKFTGTILKATQGD
jgi:hypothetical protein